MPSFLHAVYVAWAVLLSAVAIQPLSSFATVPCNQQLEYQLGMQLLFMLRGRHIYQVATTVAVSPTITRAYVALLFRYNNLADALASEVTGDILHDWNNMGDTDVLGPYIVKYNTIKRDDNPYRLVLNSDSAYSHFQSMSTALIACTPILSTVVW